METALNRRQVNLALLGLSLPASSAWAEDYPSRPIDFVTQSSVGGGGDVLARQLGEIGRDLIGQPTVVTNKPGAGGRNLENYVSTAKPDGYTLVVTTASSLIWYYTGALTMHITTDLRPIIRLQVEPNLVVVRANAPWQTMKDLIAAAKADQVTFGGLPVGGAEHMLFTKLAKDNGYRLRFVPYGGGGEATTSLLGGNIDATVLQTSEAADHVRAGTIRVLGVSSPQRIAGVEFLQGVPTLSEQGIDFVFEHWRGIHTLAAVPDSVVDFLHAKFQEASERPAWNKWLNDTGQLRGNMAPAAFQAYTIEQDRRIRELATEVGVNKRK